MTMPAPLGVAVVGCGTISDEYLRNLTAFPDLSVLYCADLDLGRAKKQAAAYGVPAAGTLAQALAHDGVELVVNLTLPGAHAEVAAAAIAAGKHVWNEKPLTTDPATGRALLRQAERAGVRVGCAPDTVLGAGQQTARRLIQAGAIGTPQTALALMQSPGPESWHHSPEFLFQPGAGPLFDLGPYYFSALATVFGPASRVAAVGPPPCCSASTPRCPGTVSSRSPGPRRRWPSPTRTGSPGTSGFTAAAVTAGRRTNRPAPRPGAAWECWTWRAACGPGSRTAPPASWRCTSWR